MKMFDNNEWLIEKITDYLPSAYKKTSKDINFSCPICGDSKKDRNKKRGHLYLENARYFCFNCDASCSALELLKHLSGEDYHSLKRQYIKETFKSGGSSSQSTSSVCTSSSMNDSLNSLQSVIPDSWKNPLSLDAETYLRKRKIFDAPFLDDQEFYTCYDKEKREFILIPWVINGVECYYQINDYKKHAERKYIFPYDKTKMIYGLDNVDRSFQYVICFEGVYDSLFVKNGIAIGGKSLTANQLVLLKTMFPYHKIVMALDNDKAGKDAAMKAIKNDPSMMFFNLIGKYPDAKDINELVINRNNVNLFSDKNVVKSMICSSLQAKLLLKGFNL